jgi:hypothetical protein
MMMMMMMRRMGVVWRGVLQKGVDGDARYRSLYLSHAKRALCHLSYIPLRVCTVCSAPGTRCRELNGIHSP